MHDRGLTLAHPRQLAGGDKHPHERLGGLTQGHGRLTDREHLPGLGVAREDQLTADRAAMSDNRSSSSGDVTPFNSTARVNR